MTILFSDEERQESAGNCSERIREYSSPIVTKYVQEILLRPGLGILFDKFKFQEYIVETSCLTRTGQSLLFRFQEPVS